MARARNIKPGLFKNELLGVADPLMTILFTSLWCLADKSGRLEDRPLRIKAETFPYRENLDVNRYLTELARLGFIHRYQVGDLALIQVLEFDKHQKPHNTESPSKLPAFDSKSLNHKTNGSLTVNSPLSDGENSVPARPDSLIPDSLIADSLVLIQPNTSSADAPVAVERRSEILEVVAEHDLPAKEISKKVSTPRGDAGEDVREVFTYWQQAMGHPQAKLDAKREKAIKARIKDGYTVGQLCQAVDGCKLSPHHMGQNETRTIYDDIELICRDGSRVDKFIKLSQALPSNGRTSNQQQTIDALNRYMQRGGHAN